MTNIKEFLKTNKFLSAVGAAYILLALIRPQMSMQGIKNSGYYIKEMLMIMPVIFVLTALLDSWVPKATIIKFLGKEAGGKGIFLSFVLGSISAGPIYAAFPFCVMLRKKGAAIRNIVIILSAWAVVKVPMLLNETKFLGPKFMLIRWVLTVLAILIFSGIAEKIVKEEDFPKESLDEQTGIFINKKACMGCTLCTKKAPELFEMDGKRARIKAYDHFEMKHLEEAMEGCPVKAIGYKKEY